MTRLESDIVTVNKPAKEVFEFLKEKIFALNKLGIHDVIVDPGFGFGKTSDHNFTLLQQLENFRLFGLPLLAGLSRKSIPVQ